MSTSPHHVVLLGQPGSGIIPLARQLATRYALRHIDLPQQLRHDPAMVPFAYRGRFNDPDVNRYLLTCLDKPGAGYVWSSYPATPSQWRFFSQALTERHQPLLLVVHVQVTGLALARHLVRGAIGQAHPSGIDHPVGDDLRLSQIDVAVELREAIAHIVAATSGVYLSLDFHMGEGLLLDTITRAYQARLGNPPDT